jgi:cation:H+ antiporter
VYGGLPAAFARRSAIIARRFEARSRVILSIALIILGIVLLLTGGRTMLRGAVGLATLLRLTPGVIGVTVVAAGTSMPELAVSASAALQGKTDIAVANVVGSNIFNITVILGLCAVISPLAITGNVIKLGYPVLAMVTLLCVLVAQDGWVGRLDAALFLCIYVAFTLYLVALVRKQVSASEAQKLATEVKELTPAVPAAPHPRAWVCVALVAAGIALLGGGAHATVTGAVQLARLLGWSERVIGLTIVSIGTSLPEVAASVVSSVRGRNDVAIGNVFGSNLFNILAILGLTGLASPLPVQAALVSSDFWWMLGVTLLLFPLIFTARKMTRWEGALMLAAYGRYLSLLLRSR